MLAVMVVALALVLEVSLVVHRWLRKPPASAPPEVVGSQLGGVATVKTAPPLPAPEQKQLGPLPPKFTNSLGMEFVLVPKGKSWLGHGNRRDGKEVEIALDDFYLGAYEVTQGEWEKVTGANPSHFSREGEGKDAVKAIPDADLKRFPVENVTWDDAQSFLKLLNTQAKEAGWLYRLPKETEWEYACRGGPLADRLDSAFDFYFEKPTNELQPEQANFEHAKGLKRPCKVGSYKPNRLGLYDMHGNVWEWCDDFRDPPRDLRRALRGGGWHNASGNCRAAQRAESVPSGRGNHLGLRVARVPVGK